jgi:hypothetical protein
MDRDTALAAAAFYMEAGLPIPLDIAADLIVHGVIVSEIER